MILVLFSIANFFNLSGIFLVLTKIINLTPFSIAYLIILSLSPTIKIDSVSNSILFINVSSSNVAA